MTGTLHAVHEIGHAICVSDDSQALFRYVYGADDPQQESPRPYFHPIRSRAGDVVTVYRPWDHVWHKGLALSLPHFGDDNFWGGPTFVRNEGYQWLPNNGAMRPHGDLMVDADAERIRFGHSLRWITQRGLCVAEEDRRICAQLVDESAWALVFDTSVRNVSDDAIHIGSPTTAGRDNAGYGGLFWRGPRAFEGARVFTDSASGQDAVMGSTAPWAAIAGQHDETARWSTIMIIDDPANPRHPTKWFARSTPFACLCPAPFFDEEYTFAVGDVLRLRYAVIVANGPAEPAASSRRAAQGTHLLEATRRPRTAGEVPSW